MTNRTISFRVWWKNKMRHNAIAGNGQALFIPDATGEYKQVNFAECEVMQFAGEIDINGIEIFEGDIITLKSYNYHHLNRHSYQVIFESMAFKFLNLDNGDVYDRVGLHSFQVIGNIHEGIFTIDIQKLIDKK